MLSLSSSEESLPTPGMGDELEKLKDEATEEDEDEEINILEDPVVSRKVSSLSFSLIYGLQSPVYFLTSPEQKKDGTCGTRCESDM